MTRRNKTCVPGIAEVVRWVSANRNRYCQRRAEGREETCCWIIRGAVKGFGSGYFCGGPFPTCRCVVFFRSRGRGRYSDPRFSRAAGAKPGSEYQPRPRLGTLATCHHKMTTTRHVGNVPPQPRLSRLSSLPSAAPPAILTLPCETSAKEPLSCVCTPRWPCCCS